MERIENWAGLGFPDVFINADGQFHLLELKYSEHNAVKLRPHQVSFHSRNQNGSSWILVKRAPENKTAGYEMCLYHASQAIEVSQNGLKTKPKYKQNSRDNWENLFDAITKQKEALQCFGY